MSLRNNAWTDEFYQLASFLYNEPQRIGKQKITKGNMQIYDQTIANLQKLEYPLNNLFNIMMRLLPQRLKRQILSCFASAPEADFGQKIEYFNNFDELPFIRPDTVLQSEQAHICIELKIGAKLGLKQVYKYLRFLGQWKATSDTVKTPYLFFLTKGDLHTSWKTKERPFIFTEADEGYEILENLVSDFLRELEKRRLWQPTH
jgi:hypothetical protein